MKCPNCNYEVTQPTKFCPECGTKLPAELNETVAPATPQSTTEQEANPAKKPKKSKKKLILIISISVACLAVLAGAFFILYAINPGCMFGHDSTREEKIKEATCTDSPRYRYVCVDCGEIDYERSWGSFLEHDYGTIQCGVPSTCKNCGGAEKTFEHELVDGVCTRCEKKAITLQLPTIPMLVHERDSQGNIEQTVQITQLEHANCLNWIYVSVTFAAKRIYHERGDNYSAQGYIGWKVYDANGVVIDSGTARTDGNIKVGETSYGSFTIEGLKEWTEGYRLEILSIS